MTEYKEWGKAIEVTMGSLPVVPLGSSVEVRTSPPRVEFER
jgi:hypothetical protein